MTITGPDCSHHQGPVDWVQVAGAGAVFAICKATEGTGNTDPTFARNWAGMKAAGILRSAYHFARPGVGSAESQADRFAATVGPLEPGDLPLCLDLEATTLDKGATTRWALAFLTELDRLTGRRSIIYTGPGFIAEHLNAEALTSWPLWLAQYGPAARTAPWPDYLWWQFTDHGHFPGISGGCDTNRCELTRDQIAALGHPPTPQPPGDFLMALTDAQQKHLLETVDATALRVAKLEAIIDADGQTASNPNGAAKGTILGRIRDGIARLEAKP